MLNAVLIKYYKDDYRYMTIFRRTQNANEIISLSNDCLHFHNNIVN